MTVKSAWARALNTQDDGKLISRLGMVYTLPREIERQLKRLDDYDSHDMTWWPPLAIGLTQAGLSVSFASISGVLENLGPIRSAARRLQNNSNLAEPEFSTPLSELKALLDHFIDEINNSGLENEDLTDFLFLNLEAMQDLLDDIQIVGAVGVYPRLSATVSEVSARATGEERERHPDFWEKWDLVVRRFKEAGQAVAVWVAIGGSLSVGGLLVAKNPQAAQPAFQPQLEQPHTEPKAPSLPEPNPSPKQDDDSEIADAEFKLVDDDKDEAA